MGLSSVGADNPPRRIGSLGHAIAADALFSDFVGRPRNTAQAVAFEVRQRGWDPAAFDLEDETHRALEAVRTLLRELDVRPHMLVPDLYSGEPGGPLVERRLRVSWRDLFWFLGADSLGLAVAEDLSRCDATLRAFAGIEGQPDLVLLPHGPAGPALVLDYKLRQKPDLGGGEGDATTATDPQAAWYPILLGAAGFRPAGGLEFEQVNVYAGSWLGVEDFVRAEPGDGLVTSYGLPTTSADRLGEHGWCTADTWAEAWRVLVDRRRVASIGLRDLRGRAKKERTATDAEAQAASDFIARLREWRPVVRRRHRADPSVARDQVRDMVVAVEGPLLALLRGLPPARHLQSHPRSACRRPGGCDLQEPCASALGTGRVLDVLRERLAQGSMRSVLPPPPAAQEQVKRVEAAAAERIWPGFIADRDEEYT